MNIRRMDKPHVHSPIERLIIDARNHGLSMQDVDSKRNARRVVDSQISRRIASECSGLDLFRNTTSQRLGQANGNGLMVKNVHASGEEAKVLQTSSGRHQHVGSVKCVYSGGILANRHMDA
jgi:hypothetical protein